VIVASYGCIELAYDFVVLLYLEDCIPQSMLSTALLRVPAFPNVVLES
jgi:hypothetical protein